MTNDNHKYEVIIIGGGPAGIATSLSLSARGILNCVVEAKENPVAKSGEAIPPNAKPLLKQLGIMHLIDNPKHTIYYGNKSSWGTNLLEQKEFIQGIHGHGYLLNRLYFETQLRAHLKQVSNNLKAGHQLKKVNDAPNGVEVLIDNGKETQTLHAKYVVDATGRKASVCRQLGVSKRNLDSQFAVTFSAHLSRPVEHQVIVEATESGWWYAAPQEGKELNIMFFTLKELLPHKTELKSFIQTELVKSLHVSELLTSLELQLDNIKIKPTGTSRLDIPYGKNWVAVGDAANSYDPISSYGITSALASGYYAGHALADHLALKKDALLTYRYLIEKTFQIYSEKLINHYTQENRWENSTYWKNRFQSNFTTL